MVHSSVHHNAPIQFQEDGEAEFKHNLEPSSDDCRVLVVHHHPGTLHMMTAMFRKLGYQVAAALDSTKAFLYFSRISCHLLFTDFEMPVLN